MSTVRKRFLLLFAATAALALTSCVTTGGGSVHPYSSLIPHAPAVRGYRQLPVEMTGFRDRAIAHPGGKWTVSFGEQPPLPPVLITTASGKRNRLEEEWYPEEGGADAPSVHAFTKGDETLLILQGTSDLTYEETWITYKGENIAGMRRYAAKGAGMGPDAPGIEPKYKVYP